MVPTKRIGDICEVLNGFAFKSEEYVDGGIRIMRITNVQKGQVVDDDPKYFPVDRSREIEKYLLREGDLLMSLTGNVGRVGLIPNAFLPAALNQRVACLRIKSEDVMMEYLFHALNSNSFEEDCIFNASGIAQKNMSTRWLESYTIPVPSIKEQQRIVAELDLLSGILNKQRKQLKELDILSQSVFVEMFGAPEDNEMGWRKSSISSFSTCVAGATPSTAVKEYWENGTIPWLSSGEVAQGRIYSTDKRITPMGYNSASTKMIPAHTVLVALAGQGKTRGTVGVAEIPMCTNQSICSILCDDTVDTDFLYFQLKLLYNELRSISNGDGGRGGLNLKLVGGFKVILPPLDLQQLFGKKLRLIESQADMTNRSIAETQKLFDYTMDKYFG